MVRTAFRASADTLSQTSYGGFTEMIIKMDQLYRSMASTLRPLQASLSVDSEIVENLRRLCVVFDHVEKLVTLATSLHLKFLDAPRLSGAIFSDYLLSSNNGNKFNRKESSKRI